MELNYTHKRINLNEWMNIVIKQTIKLKLIKKQKQFRIYINLKNGLCLRINLHVKKYFAILQ